MKKVKCVGRGCAVAVVYLILLEISKLIEFGIFMRGRSVEDLNSGQWSWMGMPESWFFLAPFGTGLFRVLAIATILCVVFHGRDFAWKRIRQIPKIAGEFWHGLSIQAAAASGVILGICYVRGLDRFATAVSSYNIYYFLSGTTALRGMPGEQSETLQRVAEIFHIFVRINEPDMLAMLVAFVVYKLLRICFDRKVAMKTK